MDVGQDSGGQETHSSHKGGEGCHGNGGCHAVQTELDFGIVALLLDVPNTVHELVCPMHAIGWRWLRRMLLLLVQVFLLLFSVVPPLIISGLLVHDAVVQRKVHAQTNGQGDGNL